MLAAEKLTRARLWQKNRGKTDCNWKPRLKSSSPMINRMCSGSLLALAAKLTRMMKADPMPAGVMHAAVPKSATWIAAFCLSHVDSLASQLCCQLFACSSSLCAHLCGSWVGKNETSHTSVGVASVCMYSAQNEHPALPPGL